MWLKNHVAEFLIDLGISRPKLDGVLFKSLMDEQRDWLERPFNEGEIENIIWSIEDDKALVGWVFHGLL